MTTTSLALDEAFDRMARTDFELPNGFVNHGPMACEALATLGLDDQVDGWARWIARSIGEGPEAADPRSFGPADWQSGLGDYSRLPEWIGLFDRALDDDGWPAVVERWIPRLLPGMATVLFHGVIRTAHAVRAIDAVDTPARRAELARALAYWAARYRPGQPVTGVPPEGSVGGAVLTAGALGARYYLAGPNILNLHGVTGAMAVHLLVGHVGGDTGAQALAQLQAEHAALYRGADPAAPADPADAWDDGLPRSAAASHDAHQVKLVEACRRGFEATGDGSFAAAARRVTDRR